MKSKSLAGLFTIIMVALTSTVLAQNKPISYWRPYDQDGVNQFEYLKKDYQEFDGLKVRVGGAFTQQFQALDHENNAVDLDNDGNIDNALIGLEPGFNLATANLNLDVQLADGVRLNLITYLSSRHHPEAWVKGGYIQFDKLPFLKSDFFDELMENVMIRIGHMEVNYGDAHFRRTDNGNAMYNPFVGNYVMDAFNTEIGAEGYLKLGDAFGMLGITGGEINGNVGKPRTSENDDKASRSPSIIGKLGFDKQVNEDLRARITGSVYHTASSATNHIFDGDRGGSRYYLVMSPPGVSAGDRGIFDSGRYNPGFTDKVTTFMGNVFLGFKGLELFGTYETANGRDWFEADERNANQYAVDLIYRFGGEQQFYLGGRYNKVDSEERSETGSILDVSIDRYQIGAGWFLTKNVLAKAEYVNQEYDGFPTGSLLDQGKFNGFMVEAVIGF